MKKTKSTATAAPAKAKQNTKEERVRGGGFEWVTRQGVRKDQWLGVVEDGKVPPRIKQLDAKTFTCYRDGRYLGSEPTLEKAFARIRSNDLSEKNKTMIEWEKKHPGELPPGLALTAKERAEYWNQNPPRAATRADVRGRAGKPEDPGTAKLRAELAAEAGNRAAGQKKRAAGGGDAPVGTIRVKPGAVVPKKPGSGAHARWTMLWSFDGKTVDEYQRARGNMTTLANAMKKNYVTVEK